MRDQRYYQRLNEIREKYGYLNGFGPGPNPEEESKGLGRTATQINHNAGNSNHYQTPLRSAQNQLNFAQLESKRAKDNKSTPPVNYANGGNGNITAQRIYREKVIEQERPKYNYQKENSSPYRPSQVPTPSNKRQRYTPTPIERPNYSEYSSPIKRLGDLSNRDTPRELSKFGEKSTCLKPNKNYRTQYGNHTERLMQDNPRISDQLLKQATQASLKNRANYTDKPTRNPEKDPMIPPHHSQGEQYNSKYNTNLNSIDRIQQKIQAVLNKIKK